MFTSCSMFVSGLRPEATLALKHDKKTLWHEIPTRKVPEHTESFPTHHALLNGFMGFQAPAVRAIRHRSICLRSFLIQPIQNARAWLNNQR
jgi:hypothetical protein